jgi:phosphoesterase RecJ-like protein
MPHQPGHEAPPASDSDAPPLDDAIAQLRLALRSRPPVTTLCHENPDGDTIGAAVAMALVAEQLGCRAEIVSADRIPPAYHDLLGGIPVSSTPRLRPGLAVVCDAATLTRVGRVAAECQDWLEGSTIVNIDHHVTNDRFGAINLVDPAAAASCEVVSLVVDALGVPLDARIATAILTGIVRDSHGFSAASTRAATFRAAARAVEAGAEVEPIYRAALLEMEPAAVDLWGRLLGRVERSADGRIVHTMLLPDDLEVTGAEQHDAEGLVEFLMRERGVEIGILFRQLDDGIRISFRTGASVDAARLAASFGGGGHTRRAGCHIPAGTGRGPSDVIDVCRAALT